MSSTTSTATPGAALHLRVTPQRRKRTHFITTVLKALGSSRTHRGEPAPSTRRVGPIDRDYALDPAYHLRMVR